MFPGQFIELLEEAGWIDDVGRWILQQACRQGAAWQRRGMNLSVNVNASAIQLQSESFGDDISKALSDSGFDPKCLVIEITESVLMQNHADTVARLQELKSLGVRIALDDFGTGYSSFAYLQDLPVDILKIDRSFVAKLGVPGAPGNLVRALVSIARELGMTTTAEGIESEAQLLSLRDAGCNLGQGYWIAAPLCAEEILPFVSSWGSSRHSLGLPAAR
jgi:EAL domain-containing protein (putative c-di-GMP-specific phosphodiesterase class I)